MKINRSSEQSVEYRFGDFLVQMNTMRRPTLEYLRVRHILAIVIEVNGRSALSAGMCGWQYRFGGIESVLLRIL